MRRELMCIICPRSCLLSVEFTKKGIRKVIGAICKKGEKYAKEEIFSPKRVLTSSIRVLGGELPLVSVKTDRPIPREKIMDVMKVIYKAKRRAPVKAGSILIRNVAGIGVNIIATKEVHKFSQGSL